MMSSIPIPTLIPIQFSFAWELHGNSIPMGTLIPIMGMRVTSRRVFFWSPRLQIIVTSGVHGIPITMGTLIPIMGMRVPMVMGIPCTPLVTIICKRGDQKNTRRLVTGVRQNVVTIC